MKNIDLESNGYRGPGLIRRDSVGRETDFNEELLLAQVCEKIGLPESLHGRASTLYKSAATWLTGEGSPFRKGRVYVQGSAAIGTTAAPVRRKEFDLDGVVEADLDVEPVEMLDLLEGRFAANAIYEPRIERKNRCIRLFYANDFYMDFLPARPNYALPLGCVLVPDRRLECWKHSAPKGFIHWFRGQCRLRIINKLAEARYIEPAPDFQDPEERYTLQHVVLLIKRARDLAFLGRESLAPLSIVLTTLAGELYEGEQNVTDAITAILEKLNWRLQGSHGPIEVRNPANPQEILSERWDDNPAAYEEFRKWVLCFAHDWQDFRQQEGIHRKAKVLEALFGEKDVRAVILESAERIEGARSNSALSVNAAGGLLVGSAAATGITRVRPNTFFGD